MSTDHTASLDNNLVLGDLMTTPPGATEKGHNHPFLSLKVLHETVGEDSSLSLSTLTEQYVVNSYNYINAQYPLSEKEPYI